MKRAGGKRGDGCLKNHCYSDRVAECKGLREEGEMAHGGPTVPRKPCQGPVSQGQNAGGEVG